MKNIFLFLAILIFPLAVIGATGEVSIPRDSVVKQREKNFFLALADSQFKPFAEVLITGKYAKNGCVSDVFFGGRGRYNTSGGPGVDTDPVQLRRDLKMNQDFCQRSIDSGIQEIGRETGIFKLYKLSHGAELAKGQHIFDPRVYERAKKMLGNATTKKKEGK